jgi:hypothetical protein
MRWSSSWTPRALQRRLVSDHGLTPPAEASLERLVDDIELARYARPVGPGRSTEALRGDVQIVVRAVAADHERGTRQRARWFPRSGVSALINLARRVDAAADEAGRRAADLGSDARRAVTSGRR